MADDPHVQWFIVRDADSRLIDRDATAVDAWMKEGSAAHCERDHPSHGEYSLSGKCCTDLQWRTAVTVTFQVKSDHFFLEYSARNIFLSSRQRKV